MRPSFTFWCRLCLLLGSLGACLPLPLAQALEVKGEPYVALTQVAARFGMRSSPLEAGKHQRLFSEWTQLRFTQHRREVSLNNLTLHFGFPVVLEQGQLYISEADVRHNLQPLLTPQAFTPAPRLKRIVLDPGHGGKDSGARSPGALEEKQLALNLAQRLKRLLEARGFQVYLTRDSDVFVPLEERAAKANRWRADLFISLHFNAATNRSVSGLESFVFTPRDQPSTARGTLHSSDRRNYLGNRNDPWNALVGFYLQRSMVEQLRQPDRGLKRARFTVLRDLKMPGVLIEGGFVSHAGDERRLRSEAYLQRLADALARGVLRYEQTLTRLR